MTDVPLSARVECAGNRCGRSTHAIINPATQQVTHFVVKAKGCCRTEHLVPVDLVAETTSELICMRCTRDELAAIEPFIETRYVQVKRLHKDYPHLKWAYPYRNAEEWVPVEHVRVPRGELAVHRGIHVRATDGRVGHVEKLSMDPASGCITHLVMRKGHPWTLKDVTIPISEISRIGKRAVYLAVDRHNVESLPAVSAKWH